MAIPWLIGGAITAAVVYVASSDSSDSRSSGRSTSDVEEDNEQKRCKVKREQLQDFIAHKLQVLVEEYQLDELDEAYHKALNDFITGVENSEESSDEPEDYTINGQLLEDWVETLMSEASEYQNILARLTEARQALDELQQAEASLKTLQKNSGKKSHEHN